MKQKKRRLLSLCLSAVMTLSVLTVGVAPSATAQEEAPETSFLTSFQDPSGAERPRTRWWVPGSHMTVEEIRSEMESMVNAGFGGAEIVPVSTSGEGGSGIDWGTEQWNSVIKSMLEIAGEYDFTIDFTMTPAWPLALPTITDLDDPDSGAQMEVDGAWIDGITAETPYDGQVPVSEEAVTDTQNGGTPVLLAVTVAKYADKENKILDYDSARTLEEDSLIKGEGATDYTVAFTPEEEGEYVLYAWWQHPSGEQKYGNNQIDHFGKAGSQAIIDYWENNLLPYYGDAFENCSALFIDSLEFATHLDWTWGLLEDFEKRYDYDLTPYLAGVYQASASGNYSGNPSPDFSFDKNTEQVLNDYKDEITQLYIENHLTPLSEFCEEHGVQLRYQTSYGKSMELAQTAMHVDIPETETLYGKDIVDFYRLQAGAVHLTDKPVYSIEASPEQNTSIDLGFFVYELKRGNGEDGAGNYQQTWDDQLWHIQRAFAGGVNQIVFHGYSYNGQYDGEGSENGYVAGVQWPGFEGFGAASWSNSWGERQPNWIHADSYTDFIARNQMVLREGTQKVDLAIYALRYWETIDFSGATRVYQDNSALEHSGYSYDFVSPAALELDNATVTDGRLDINGPAYKAILLDHETAIPQQTAEQLLSYAEQGFPILFIGTVPSENAYSGEDTIAQYMEQLFTYDCVRLVDSTEEVPDVLAQLGVQPNASYDASLLSVHRQSDDADFYYLYNDANAEDYPSAKSGEPVSAAVTLKGEGIPYQLNAWTGEITPIAEYTAENGTVTVKADLAANESTIIAIAEPGWCGIEVPEQSIISCEAGATAQYDAFGRLIVKSSEGGEQSVVLSDGTSKTLDFGPTSERVTLSNWDLTVESWSEGATPTDTRKEAIHIGTLDTLVPWTQIEGLEQVSGIGTYTTTLTLEQGWDKGYGAVLNLGDVVDSYEVTVNDTTLPTNQINTNVDIGSYLVTGENTITVEVASTLLNAVLAANESDTRDPDEYGIVNDVTLTPYAWRAVQVVDEVTAPETAQVNADFVVSVVVDNSVTDVKLFNENDMALGRKDIQIIDNGDGTKTFDITVAVGTVGEGRTFKIVTKGLESYYKDSGVRVSLDITSIPASIMSFDLPEETVANRTFIITATTDLSATKIEVFNENGMKMGLTSLSSKVVDGQKVWTGVMSIGTQGERTFSCYAVNKYGDRSEALTDNISVKAFA